MTDIAARDALTSVLTGDSAYVLDTGEGEWGLYFYDGNQWSLVATQDSAAVDANSLSHTFTCPIGGFGTAQNITLGRISDNSRVVSVLVEVITPLTGYTGGVPALDVGTAAEPERLMSDLENDLESTGSYTTNPDFHYTGNTELELKANLSHLGATQGQIKVTVTYV